MTVTQQRASGGGEGFEIALIGLGAVVMGLGAATFAGARLAIMIAGHGQVSGGLGEWLIVLWRLGAGEGPAGAWRDAGIEIPTGFGYWAPAAFAYLGLIALVAGIIWIWRVTSRPVGRERFGQPTDARQANPKDVLPLRVDDVIPPTGRMLLGRMVGHRKILLATEDRQRHPLKGKAAERQGSRGSVAMIGPTGSGKTANMIAAITTWDGPVVNVSVKRDLYDVTVSARSSLGEIAVFDPGAATGLATARWSPLANVSTSSGALRAGRALAQAIPRSGVSSADYWAKHGEKLLSAFMSLAGLARFVDDGGKPHHVGMEQVASWVTMMAGDRDPIINDLLRRGLNDERPLEIQLMARQAATTFIGIGKEDHKIRSSIYATAALAVDPWLEPAVAHSSTTNPRKFYNDETAWDFEPRLIDLEWLASGNNTLYLTASQPEFERLSPVLGGLLAELKDSLHAWDIAGRKLDKPLLIVIDEAGQLELGWLPAEVSTIAALGAFFVTAWQSLSQVQHRYSTQSDAVLSGHRTKCFFAGIDDLATVNYLKGLLGSEHVTRLSYSADLPTILGDSRHRRSRSESVQQEEFAPANALRQMKPGEAVLLHGTLPPVHIEAIRWWAEAQLAALVPLNEKGDPSPPVGLGTCPVTDAKTVGAAPRVDTATLRSSLSKPQQAADGEANPPMSEGFDGRGSGPAVAGDKASGSEVRRVNARCERCGRQLGKDEGVQLTTNGKQIAVCSPSCLPKTSA